MAGEHTDALRSRHPRALTTPKHLIWCFRIWDVGEERMEGKSEQELYMCPVRW